MTRSEPEPDERKRDAEEDPDFAPEHTKATFADEQPGGPERRKDPDSPAGLAGADP